MTSGIVTTFKIYRQSAGKVYIYSLNDRTGIGGAFMLCLRYSLALLGNFEVIAKRCDQTGRTVIGPDPTLKMGQLGVPIEIADNLTIPVQVNNFNIEEMTKLVNEGHANYVIKKSGAKINLKYALFRKGTELIYGDEIHRTNDDGKEIIIKVLTGKEKLLEGDRLKRNDKFLEDVKYPQKKSYTLEPGDIVERKLKDGDYALLNRQPTEHLC